MVFPPFVDMEQYQQLLNQLPSQPGQQDLTFPGSVSKEAVRLFNCQMMRAARLRYPDVTWAVQDELYEADVKGALQALDNVIRAFPDLMARPNYPWVQVREFVSVPSKLTLAINIDAITLAFYTAAQMGGVPKDVDTSCPLYGANIPMGPPIDRARVWPEDVKPGSGGSGGALGPAGSQNKVLAVIGGVAVVALAGLLVWFWPRRAAMSRTRTSAEP